MAERRIRYTTEQLEAIRETPLVGQMDAVMFAHFYEPNEQVSRLLQKEQLQKQQEKHEKQQVGRKKKQNQDRQDGRGQKQSNRRQDRPDNSAFEDAAADQLNNDTFGDMNMPPDSFDMEKFKAEMRKRDGVEPLPSAREEAPPIALAVNNEPKFEEAFSVLSVEEPLQSARQSRFGGRFFRLDEDEPASNSTPNSAISPTPATPLPMFRQQSAFKASLATPNSALKKSNLSFDAGVPTSVMRKLSTNSADVRLSAKMEKTPSKSIPYHQMPPLSHGHHHPAFSNMPGNPMLPPFNAGHPPAIANLFPAHQTPLLPNHSRLPSNILNPAVDVNKPIIHTQADGTQIELPPPQVFVQMLLANNLPVPPEMMQFLPPPTQHQRVQSHPESNVLLKPNVSPQYPVAQHQQQAHAFSQPPPNADPLAKFFGNLGPVNNNAMTPPVHHSKIKSLADIEKQTRH